MDEKLPYLGKSWRDEAFARLKAALTPEKMNGITTSMVNLYANCPDGTERWLYVECSLGELVRFETGEGQAPAAEFSITGDWSTFASISRAELGSQRALMTGKLRLKGNMAKALRLAPLADRINKVLSTVPTAY